MQPCSGLDGSARNGMEGRQVQRPELVLPAVQPGGNRCFGYVRSAWLAALNVTAARRFVERDPPHLSDGHASLLRLTKSLAQGEERVATREAEMIRHSSEELRVVARQAAGIADDLDRMVAHEGRDVSGVLELDSRLGAIRASMLDLDDLISSMLNDAVGRARGARDSGRHPAQPI